jgi:hypothetical protein
MKKIRELERKKEKAKKNHPAQDWGLNKKTKKFLLKYVSILLEF